MTTLRPTLAFRVTVFTESRDTYTLTAQLDRVPERGESLQLPHGDVVVIRDVRCPAEGLGGVIIAKLLTAARVTRKTASLCESCQSAQAVDGHKATYQLCTSERVALKYPRQPVRACDAYEPRPAA
jgi:hypothetical protein